MSQRKYTPEAAAAARQRSTHAATARYRATPKGRLTYVLMRYRAATAPAARLALRAEAEALAKQTGGSIDWALATVRYPLIDTL